MIDYDKLEIRNSLDPDQIFELLSDFGGEPEYNDNCIISRTICHNPIGKGSRKLYYYYENKLFHCYSGCDEPSFDVFQLVIKVMDIQKNIHFDLNDAVRFVAYQFGIGGTFKTDAKESDDWRIFSNYDRVKKVEIKKQEVTLKEYDISILKRLNYDVLIRPWLSEGISQEIIDSNIIGYYPGADQITIPHFDKDGRFVGLRGRTLSMEQAEHYGKYRPVTINKQLYNHPLGLNLYNLNRSAPNIKVMKKAIIFESEKSCLMYQTYFGTDADISVATCGSNLSSYQVQLLLDKGVNEIVIAFDRQFKNVGDEEFKILTKKLEKFYYKYKNDVDMSFILDKGKITNYKASPIDEGKDKFIYLYNKRIYLN